MGWGNILSIVLAVIFFIVSVVLLIRQARRKKPVWACKTEKIIGLDTSAPPEVKLYFGARSVSDVWQTTFVFFNRGNESVREGDVSESITMHFKDARILRAPTIRARSKEAIRFSVRQVVKDSDDAVQLGFRYLGHNDGAVVEVPHTEAQEITPSGDIMDARIVNVGEYEPYQLRPGIRQPIISSVLLAATILSILVHVYLDFETDANLLALMYLVAGASLTVLLSSITSHIRYRKFPNWSRLKK